MFVLNVDADPAAESGSDAGRQTLLLKKNRELDSSFGVISKSVKNRSPTVLLGSFQKTIGLEDFNLCIILGTAEVHRKKQRV